MHIFTIGAETHILDGYATDCTVFEVDEAGLNIFYYYDSPTAEEMQAIADELLRRAYALGGQQVGGKPLCR